MFSIKNLLNEAEKEILLSKNTYELNLARSKFLGKNSYLNKIIKKMHLISLKDRSYVGKLINTIKYDITNIILKHKIRLEKKILERSITNEKIDITLPGRSISIGGLHPITSAITDINYFFHKLNFINIPGLEIEDNYHNFDALNIPINHPSRNPQDTFWLNKKILLRTQTSSIQIRYMKHKKPPVRIISFGKVYRKDYNTTHTPMFHQMEGLVIDYNINLLHLRNIIYEFLKFFFSEKKIVRFRMSYFPFTEPSMEIDIMNNNNWLEIIGCGMVHPKVLKNLNINTKIFSGFAFGLGIERLVMIRYNINDIRYFFKNDLRFLKQFK
ncbi:MAG: phenylalanine--tRNA ligase subunit alpha [Candidatus Lightella neohaematopini]|nr:phenylalanine--tRNA ligase subunit alpha [Candidatus Lightella neohaematopini]MCV2528883.1 phenylalanine--tRNA ligase subunit alpha [Candidatus Lightella neohaematopini]